MIGSRQVEAVIEHPLVRAVTLTGSGPAGRAVAAKAGAAPEENGARARRQRSVSRARDADLELAAEVCTKARLVNSGQSCIAAKRFIVVETVRARFESACRERWPRRRWAIRSTRRPRSARRPRTTCATRCTPGRASIAKGAQVPAAAGRFPTARRLLPGHGAHGRPARHARIRRGAVRPGRRGHPGRVTKRKRSRWPTIRRSGWVGGHHARRRARRADRRRAHRQRLRVRQRRGAVGSAPAVRRHQGKRLRTRAGGYGIKEFVNIKTVYVA